MADDTIEEDILSGSKGIDDGVQCGRGMAPIECVVVPIGWETY